MLGEEFEGFETNELGLLGSLGEPGVGSPGPAGELGLVGSVVEVFCELVDGAGGEPSDGPFGTFVELVSTTNIRCVGLPRGPSRARRSTNEDDPAELSDGANDRIGEVVTEVEEKGSALSEPAEEPAEELTEVISGKGIIEVKSGSVEGGKSMVTEGVIPGNEGGCILANS
jgi:hypothetical protein